MIPILVFGSWFISNGIASKYMIDYEKRDSEYFFGFARIIPAYMFRFFHLCFYPITIYWLQKEINKYEA
jgi:hypothetical protein